MYGIFYECKFLTIEETNKKKKNKSYRFWETEIYTPSVFRIYADIHG